MTFDPTFLRRSGRFSLWSQRLDDVLFSSLDDLGTEVRQRREESWEMSVRVQDLRAFKGDDDSLLIEVNHTDAGKPKILAPSNWAFAQLARYVNAPSDYLSRLPADMAASNLNWGMQSASRAPLQILGRGEDIGELRAVTSQAYQRIWDETVLDMVQHAIDGERWEVPLVDHAVRDSQNARPAANALSVSDRYMYIFLVDRNNPVRVRHHPPLRRGFIIWNSEVGASSVSLTTFLYREYCCNRIISGMTHAQEVKVRHIGRAVERLNEEWLEFLRNYAGESATGIEKRIRAAQEYETPGRAEGGWLQWLRAQGFTAQQARAGIKYAKQEEGQAASLWDIIQGLTASARQIQHTDTRVQLEVAAGRLMQCVHR